SAQEALALLDQYSFSVVLTDQQMPKCTGLEFLAQVKQQQPDATRILITGALSLATVIDSINKGEIYRFIVKPWLREELLATLKNAVQRYEMICKNDALMVTTLAMNAELKQANSALSQNLQRSVELCLKTMETFYPTLGSQARRVHELSRAMAEGLNLARDERETLEVSAWLHDIGLVGVSRELIRRSENSPSSLSAAEKALVQQHPVLGQELASFVHDLEAVGQVIRAHHERWDGKGFPDKLKREKIPWLARLLAVAVAYAESPQDGAAAIERVNAGKGTAFDPEAVKAFLKCLPQASVDRREREVPLNELKPGMVLSQGVCSRNGVVIVPDGQRLTDAFIEKINRHHRLKPITQPVLIYS
ncbi:MAG TPA: HD domain-containing phosphohydrolase, partial [Candidatus Dormibacteraeota bacterium]|nr:HD domain-containing phosphohydrolase [Candidatus Dormibacteraeota bacterium]